MNVLQEDNGNTSMTRILSLVIVAAGIGIGVGGMLTKTLTTEAVTLSLGLVTIGSGLKAASKGLEK